MIFVFRAFRRAWWVVVPHPFIAKSQFASGICRRCGFQHKGVRY